MKKRLYTLYDLVSESVIGGIIQEVNDMAAARTFYDALKASDSPLAQHPQDYNLLYVGTLHEDGVIMDAESAPRPVVATGASWVEASTPALVKEGTR